METTRLRDAGVVVLAGIVLMFVAPLVLNFYTLTLLVIYGLLALSLGLIWGFGGILCFGQAAFYGLGAYAYAVSAANIGESTLPMLIAIAVPFVFAFLLGAMMFYGRLTDVYMGVITLVVTLIFFRFMNTTAGPEYQIGTARLGGYNGMPGYQTLNVPGDASAYIYDSDLYYVSFVILLIVYVLVRLLLASPFGRIAVAIRENESRVELMGYDARFRKSVLFAIGGGIAGLAGALYASWAEIVTPGIIIWCIVGGLGTLVGPVLGAAVLGYLKFALGQQTAVDNVLIMGLILVVVVLVLPRGVVPSLMSAFGSASRRNRPSAVRRGRRGRGRADG
jgi:ABC-type branched-subunit amino acid transport system permease subunit